MKKYKQKDLEDLFKFADIRINNIEHLNFSIVNREKLSSKGKTRKKEGTEGELDFLAYYRNVIWLIEWTTEGSLNTDDFDKFKTKIEKLNSNRTLLRELISKVNNKFFLNINLNVKEVRLIGLYINPSFSEVKAETIKQRLSSSHEKLIYVWDCDTFEYFKVISGTIRRFSKYEIFTHFDILPALVFSKRGLEGRKGAPSYDAIEIKKGIFGYPTYTFKIPPSMLLERCYVLRNEGWRSESFQRMVIPKKLASIREYILENKNPSFANNIIISPSSSEIDIKIDRIGGDKIKIYLPYMFGSFCIVDGQHRLYAFTQDFYGKKRNEKIEEDRDNELRKFAENSEIIVTLIKFSGNKEEILRKQTTLFKDINSNQTKVKSDFIYNLMEIIKPKHPYSIGNKTIKYLNNMEDGVFQDKFEIKSLPPYRGRIKRSSIVNWGLSELVDLEKTFFSSLYGKDVKTDEDISKYVKYCGDKLNKYFHCVKEVFEEKSGRDIWGNWRETNFMILSTSSIVGFLRLYRHFIGSNLIKDETIKERLKTIKVNFDRDEYIYFSSQWAKLEAEMFYNILDDGYQNFGDSNLIHKKHKEDRE